MADYQRRMVSVERYILAPHAGDIDAVGRGNSSKGHKPSNQRREFLEEKMNVNFRNASFGVE